jgi:hypothetical protein
VSGIFLLFLACKKLVPRTGRVARFCVQKGRISIPYTTMKQTLTQQNTFPQDFSPEFLSWLEVQKSSAKRHQLRMLKAAAVLVLCACALILLKGQPDWVQQIVQVAH